MPQFQFKQFSIHQDRAAMKVGTDGVLLGAWANGQSAKKILDIGTGTGLIALMMAQRFPAAKIDAIEIDAHASEQSLQNFFNSPFHDRIQGFHASLQEWIKFGKGNYDHLICNPPFFYKGFEVPDEKRKKARDAGFLPPEILLEAFKKITAENSRMSLILPVEEGEKFILMAHAAGIYCSRKTQVHSKPNRDAIRLLLEFSKSKEELNTGNLILENEGQHNYTEAYKALTKDFYLMF